MPLLWAENKRLSRRIVIQKVMFTENELIEYGEQLKTTGIIEETKQKEVLEFFYQLGKIIYDFNNRSYGEKKLNNLKLRSSPSWRTRSLPFGRGCQRSDKKRIIAASKHKSAFAESTQPNTASLSRSSTEAHTRVQRLRDSYTVR